jgi:hypothetical protein
MKLRGLSVPIPTFMFCDLYIPTIGLTVLLQENRWTDRGNIQIAHRHMNVEIGTEAARFLFWEYINRIFFAVWGRCPCSRKCLFKDIRPAPTPSFPHLRILPFPICCFENKQTDTYVLKQERSSPLHPFPFIVGVDS